jgi:zeaxanthin glucosyltransferase
MTLRLGYFCPPGRGHLYPGTALGRKLENRGFHVTVFNRSMTRSIVRASGLRFRPLAEPAATAPRRPQRGNIRFIGPHPVDTLYAQVSTVLEASLATFEEEHLNALIVDQADLAGGTIAASLGIPFITVCMTAPIYLNDDVPPFIFDWVPRDQHHDVRRNRRANKLLRDLLAPILTLVNVYRERRGLVPVEDLNDLFSKLAIITQLPRDLDFPRILPTAPLFHVGRFYDPTVFPQIDFPWSRHNGKAVVFATMGTVRSESKKVFEIIAAACAKFDIQLIISLGGMSLTPEAMGDLPGDPIIVHYAPQVEILQQSVLCITHAGTNTVLDSVFCGVPLIAIPVSDDQPGIAARIEWSGIGLSLPYKKLSVQRLGEAIRSVLQDETYRRAVRKMRKSVQSNGGLEKAVDIIEGLLSNRP